MTNIFEAGTLAPISKQEEVTTNATEDTDVDLDGIKNPAQDDKKPPGNVQGRAEIDVGVPDSVVTHWDKDEPKKTTEVEEAQSTGLGMGEQPATLVEVEIPRF